MRAGSIAEDVWPGLTRDGHWVFAATEKVLHDRYVDKVTTSLHQNRDEDMMEKARLYIDERVKKDAASTRTRLVNEFILQNV